MGDSFNPWQWAAMLTLPGASTVGALDAGQRAGSALGLSADAPQAPASMSAPKDVAGEVDRSLLTSQKKGALQKGGAIGTILTSPFGIDTLGVPSSGGRSGKTLLGA